MKLLSMTNLLALVLLLFIVRKIWEACWILVWRPLMISRRFKKQGISGPKYKILYGNLGEVKKMKKEANLWVLDPKTNNIFPRVFPHYHQWMSQYGETFLYWNGTKPTLYISDIELAKQILSSKLGFSIIPVKRPEVFILFGKGLPFIDGDDWVRHRRILNPAFSMDRVKAMTKPMVDCSLRMFEEWRKQSNGEVVMNKEMYKEFHRLTADIMATTAFGSSYAEGTELCKAQTELEEFYLTSLTNVFIPGTQYLPTPTNLQLWKLDNKVKDSIERIIAARLKSKCKKNYGDDLLGDMLKAAKSHESEGKMRSDEIIEECKNFYYAGQGNTTLLLIWTTMLLSLHQDWQEKLREEIFNECGKDKIPHSDTLSKLKLMNMVLMECLRLYGPVIKMTREATQDMKVGDLEIPKGTSIIVPFLKMHTDKAIWGEDAEQFNPLRFENGISQAAINPNAFIPFSVGPRACIAKNFSIIQAKTVVTMILQRFRLTLSPEYKHTPVDKFNLFAEYGIPVMLQPLHTQVRLNGTRSMTRFSGYIAFDTLELDGNTNVHIHLGRLFNHSYLPFY